MSRMLNARENSALPAYNSTDRSTVLTIPEKLSADDVDCVTIITWSTVILKGVVIVSFSNLSVEAWWEKIHAFLKRRFHFFPAWIGWGFKLFHYCSNIDCHEQIDRVTVKDDF